MTNDELNRKLAEALFTAFDLDGWYTDGVLCQQAASIAGCYRPKDFCTDGNAMLALIEALAKRSIVFSDLCGPTAHDDDAGIKERYCVVFSDYNGKSEMVADVSDETLPRAIAKAAAKALGILE
jgi:hypothetical protein